MQIQIKTDHIHIVEGREALATYVGEVVENVLRLVSRHITRVEVHFSGENSNKCGPNDKRFMIEARLEGRQPIAVAHQASSADGAVGGAADKLARLIESTLGRHREQQAQRTEPPLSGPKVA